MTDRPVCEGFAWIGQSFAHCDRCGHPYWEHTHDEQVRDGRWFRKLISRKEADAVRHKWGGS